MEAHCPEIKMQEMSLEQSRIGIAVARFIVPQPRPGRSGRPCPPWILFRITVRREGRPAFGQYKRSIRPGV